MVVLLVSVKTDESKDLTFNIKGEGEKWYWHNEVIRRFPYRGNFLLTERKSNHYQP